MVGPAVVQRKDDAVAVDVRPCSATVHLRESWPWRRRFLVRQHPTGVQIAQPLELRDVVLAQFPRGFRLGRCCGRLPRGLLLGGLLLCRLLLVVLLLRLSLLFGLFALLVTCTAPAVAVAVPATTAVRAAVPSNPGRPIRRPNNSLLRVGAQVARTRRPAPASSFAVARGFQRRRHYICGDAPVEHDLPLEPRTAEASRAAQACSKTMATADEPTSSASEMRSRSSRGEVDRGSVAVGGSSKASRPSRRSPRSRFRPAGANDEHEVRMRMSPWATASANAGAISPLNSLPGNVTTMTSTGPTAMALLCAQRLPPEGQDGVGRKPTGACLLRRPRGDVHGALGDGVPAELGDRAFPTSHPHGFGHCAVARHLVDAAAKSASNFSVSSGLNSTSRPVSPSTTTSGMPPLRTCHHRRLAGHRLQVHDAQRLVDRRAGEQQCVAQRWITSRRSTWLFSQ